MRERERIPTARQAKPVCLLVVRDSSLLRPLLLIVCMPLPPSLLERDPQLPDPESSTKTAIMLTLSLPILTLNPIPDQAVPTCTNTQPPPASSKDTRSCLRLLAPALGLPRVHSPLPAVTGAPCVAPPDTPEHKNKVLVANTFTNHFASLVLFSVHDRLPIPQIRRSAAGITGHAVRSPCPPSPPSAARDS